MPRRIPIPEIAEGLTEVAEAWPDLGACIEMALTQRLRADTETLELFCKVSPGDVRRILADGGSHALADAVAKLLEVGIQDLYCALIDLRATARALCGDAATDADGRAA